DYYCSSFAGRNNLFF
nr:immunoglobulin light chain junction region [Macaca mulatta]MOV67045.1 immunoglobulin light chain junction region [Macaca mulatta]MOV68194.1 immunoglobulin light chain junction region [Macaca mulatta]MOV70347.1 immunoglobulin light chain junction region [Macaca mulatta]MOV71520.1 immunoglobulin light chain junction region [Macaca mulatta]